ncbi:Na(+)/H(+) antiporter NhaA [compost metagenome]
MAKYPKVTKASILPGGLARPLSFAFGNHEISHSLHFWINGALMAVCFLVVGMEIQREIHGRTQASSKLAALPMAAALDAVAAPTMAYFTINSIEGLCQG